MVAPFVHGPVALGPEAHWYEIPVPVDKPDADKVALAPEHPLETLILATPAFGVPEQETN